MTIRLHWFLPTGGDSRDVLATGLDVHRRDPTLDHLALVARAAEQLGFEAVLTPTGTWCEESWISTAALIRETTRLKFLVAFRPGTITPTLAAQMAATFQRHSDGRALLNVVTGGDAGEQQRFGDWLDHDDRYARTDEFLAIVRGAWSGEPYDFDGEHYTVAGASTRLPPDPTPDIYFGGASPAAEQVAAKRADVYLTWGEPPDLVGPRIERVRKLAADEGRELRFGIRLHVITRDRAADAWAETERLLESMDDATIARVQQDLAKSQSVGQARMQGLHGGRREDLVVAPNLWAGIGLVRGGAGTALVGDHDEVAARIAEYHDLGFDEFILSGHPHLEEAFWVGEHVRPRLQRMGLVASDPTPIASGEHRAVSAAR
jgi:alkanesulfonate monooxygenase